ncbi:MAG: TIGR04283 family arsenosugar biosynthesis glycosyltransferase [Proteobacteria bacterium]|jgi:rSAM/selenodomain-associated transferase 2|nr:TIGR04283 family arsenosugar biosynthesis glycosyltransferase [Pseudomonadota bacterium]
MTPSVSIIIPVLNEAAAIADNLASLQAWRNNGVEVILVDGGSRDATRRLASQYVDRVLKASAGRACQMNTGAAVAQGEVLLFLHADTRLPSTATALVKTALAGGDRQWGRFNVRLSGRQVMFRLIERMMNMRSCLTGIVTGDHAMFVRRHVFEQVGGFPDIPLMEDIAISRRLRKISRPVCLSVPVVTSSRRWEQAGILRTVLLMWMLRLAYFLGVPPRRLAAIYYPVRHRP